LNAICGQKIKKQINRNITAKLFLITFGANDIMKAEK
jgi:hypothetical protein